MSKYSVARLEEIAEVDDGREPFRPVRHHLGITAFGITTWTARSAGDRIINEHAEDEDGDPEELYFVHSGRARFEIDGEQVDAPPGTFVLVPPGPRRTAFAEEPETTIVAIGATPGRAYEPFGWEIWAPLNRYYRAGEYAEAADRGREIIEANPEYAGPLYNLACCESLAGRKEDAIRHLRLAIERSDQLRDYAKGDSDFDAIRDEPEFRQLVGEAS
jgi:tetratricopeptide (TPR) repeat protein